MLRKKLGVCWGSRVFREAAQKGKLESLLGKQLESLFGNEPARRHAPELFAANKPF